LVFENVKSESKYLQIDKVLLIIQQVVSNLIQQNQQYSYVVANRSIGCRSERILQLQIC